MQETVSIKVQPITESKLSQVDWNNLPFGKIFTDHMLVMDYKDGAWQEAEIVPFGPIQMHPLWTIHF
jgi:branched-chain amino acid aminotransferase